MTGRRLAVVASHPIQYQAPLFRALATVTDLTVFFAHRQDASGQAAAGFGVAFDWDVPMLDGYEHRWLRNVARTPDVSRVSGCDTPEVIDQIRSGGFDACLVSGWYLKSYLQAIYACRTSGVPVMVRGDSQLGTPRSRLRSMVKYLPFRWLLRSIDAHLYVGQRNREYLRHYGVEDRCLFHVPHFVDNPYFTARAHDARTSGASAAIRRQTGAADGSLVLAFAGKLIEKKRPLDLVQAARLARDSGLDARLIVIGSGALEGVMRELAERLGVPVLFAGFRNQSEMAAYFAAADAIVLPSDGGETWGLVVNEAMACGLPALVSRAAGCSADLVTDGQTGYVFETGDVAGLARTMPRLRADLDAPGAQVGAHVAARIARYSVDSAVTGTLQALDTVRARRTRQPAAAAPLPTDSQ